MRTIVCVSALALAVFSIAADASSRTWQVKKDGTGDYTVIQDAVNHAAPGDTILIGPGRFTEYHPVNPPAKWPYDGYVEVTVSGLTLIGSGTNQTFLGPELRDPNAELPIGICALSYVTGVSIQNLAIESMESGVYRSEGGTTTIRQVAFRSCYKAVMSWCDGGTEVEECTFFDCGYGISTYPPAKDITIRQCSFTNCEGGTDLNATQNALIDECIYVGGKVGVQYAEGTRGTVRQCRFLNMTNVAVGVMTGSRMTIESCQIHGGWTRLWASNFSTVTCLATAISGGSYSTVEVSGSTATINGCHILHDAGPSVRLTAFVNPPIATLDFTGNYWGTDSADSLASWIIDHNDVPAVNAIVDFDPFSAAPLPAEQKSLGSVKNLYR